MTPSSASFDELIERFATDHLQPGEVEQFFAYLEEEKFRARYGSMLDEALLQHAYAEWASRQQSELLYDKIVKAAAIEPGSAVVNMKRTRFSNKTWLRYAAAAAILLIGAGVYFMVKKEDKPKTSLAATTNDNTDQAVLPGSNKAVLTLSNGQKMDLDNTGKGSIKDGVVAIQNEDGQLIYSGNVAADQYALNTISTPKGGWFQLSLSDGTKVWLNAASSITYPVVFNGKKREVKITGEAYFEVSADKEKPFIVRTVTDEIIVLGTAFNVNSYDDEPAVRTSLADGAVKINNTILKPGQAYANGEVAATDIRQDIAWKSGYFDFDKLPFDQALRQLARWYDVKIVYENGIPREGLAGKMERNLTLNDALEGLDRTVASFRLEGKTVYVTALQK